MTPIGLVLEKVEVITMACCTLHNFLRSCLEACSVYTPPRNLDTEDPLMHQVQLGEWHYGPQPRGVVRIARQGSNHYSSAAKDFFNSEDGEVEWQGRWCKFHLLFAHFVPTCYYRCICYYIDVFDIMYKYLSRVRL